MTVDILVPTLWRPFYLEDFLGSLREHTTDFEVCFIGQEGDEETVAEVKRLGCRLVTVTGDPATANQKLNAGFRATSNEFFFVGSDDIRFTPGWLDAAMAHMDDKAYAVGVSDGIPSHAHEGELPGHVLVRRSYIEVMSGVVDEPHTVVHEGYHHYYSDIEFWKTAQMRGGFRSAWDAHITHLHPNAGTAQIDRTAAWNRGFLGPDTETWERRQHLLAFCSVGPVLPA